MLTQNVAKPAKQQSSCWCIFRANTHTPTPLLMKYETAETTESGCIILGREIHIWMIWASDLIRTRDRWTEMEPKNLHYARQRFWFCLAGQNEKKQFRAVWKWVKRVLYPSIDGWMIHPLYIYVHQCVWEKECDVFLRSLGRRSRTAERWPAQPSGRWTGRWRSSLWGAARQHWNTHTHTHTHTQCPSTNRSARVTCFFKGGWFNSGLKPI